MGTYSFTIDGSGALFRLFVVAESEAATLLKADDPEQALIDLVRDGRKPDFELGGPTGGASITLRTKGGEEISTWRLDDMPSVSGPEAIETIRPIVAGEIVAKHIQLGEGSFHSGTFELDADKHILENLIVTYREFEARSLVGVELACEIHHTDADVAVTPRYNLRTHGDSYYGLTQYDYTSEPEDLL